jgi:hypothetical protein
MPNRMQIAAGRPKLEGEKLPKPAVPGHVDRADPQGIQYCGDMILIMSFEFGLMTGGLNDDLMCTDGLHTVAQAGGLFEEIAFDMKQRR